MRFGIRELLFLFVLLSMPVAAWWMVFKPSNEQIEEANREIRLKQQKLQQLETATMHIEDLGNEIDKLSQAVELFEAKLPAEREVEVILKEVWELAARHGLKPKSVRSEKPIKTQRYSELPLKMTINGDFDGYYKFLIDLERLSRITRISELKLVKDRKGKDGDAEAQFVLSIFFEPKSLEKRPAA
ncbi:MAG: type 4a pilus biogenesis protein PilO [Phycisphaerae bacterium]|nr:type 4a pilus biogenesis protein PilO [Phycisphaerae bacterium]